MKKYRERKKYSDLFERRFKNKLKLSEYKYDEDFYIDFIEKIQEEYEKIIENNQVNNYIIKEKNRIDCEIIKLERYYFESKYAIIIYSSLVPITTFIFKQVMDHYFNALKFKVENMIKGVDDYELISKLTNIFNDSIIEINEVMIIAFIIIIIIFFASIFLMEIIYFKNKNINDKKIVFNKMCLNVLDEIESKINQKVETV